MRPLKSRYAGEVGDVLIGRIMEIGNKRWVVDTNSKQDSALMLSSINLPGGIQRRKSENDELQMRSFFSEGEILSVRNELDQTYILFILFRLKFNPFSRTVEFLFTQEVSNTESWSLVNLCPSSRP